MRSICPYTAFPAFMTIAGHSMTSASVSDPHLFLDLCHYLEDKKQKKLTPLDRGTPLHVNRV